MLVFIARSDAHLPRPVHDSSAVVDECVGGGDFACQVWWQIWKSSRVLRGLQRARQDATKFLPRLDLVEVMQVLQATRPHNKEELSHPWMVALIAGSLRS